MNKWDKFKDWLKGINKNEEHDQLKEIITGKSGTLT